MPQSLTAKPFEALRNLPLGHAVCGGIVCTVPALLAAYLHNPLFSWSAIAAFWSYLSIPTDKFTKRWVFGLVFSLAGTLASGLGAWTVAWPALAIGLAAVFGFAGAYAQTCGARIGFPALLVATAFAVSTAFPGKDLAHGVAYAGYFFCGSLWATSFALLFQRLAQSAPPVATKGPGLWAALKSNFTPKSPTFLHGLRVALSGALSVWLVQLWSLNHGYWMTLTAFLIMQPHIARTLKMSLERVGGTLLGGAVAAAAGYAIHDPILLAALILPLSIGTLAGRSVSHITYILFLTPHFILVAHVGQPGGSELDLVFLRMLYSVIGALLATVISFVIFPRWQQAEPTAGAPSSSAAASVHASPEA